MNHKLAICSAALIVAASLSGCVGERPVAGKRISVSASTVNPSHNRVLFSSNDKENLTVPAPESNGDPTMHGGFVSVRNPETGAFDAYTLPAENWTTLPAPAQGYSYLDVKREHGPCEYASIEAGERLVASCRGEDVKFPMDEEQGTLAVDLTLGMAGGTRYCAIFGGHVMRDVSTVKARLGSFIAMDAPAPASCAMP